jgi:D-alanyl-lipoteichoic acid acyltransferase DltB (MBOAT superfamily)
MLFSSNVFLFLFLPVALLGYQLLGRLGRVAVFSWLSAVSIFFYGYWNPKYLLLLIGSILLNFLASRLIAASKTEGARTAWLVAAVTANIGLLFWFKYLFPLLHYARSIGWIERGFGSVILPLGISFFTFTQIAFLVDLKQGEAEPQDLLSYILFVTFFPHLIAGPIIHHSEMMPQFTAQRHKGLRADDLAVGTTWFALGLAKKVLIADRFGPVADLLYSNPHAFGARASWIGMLCYAIQLYFDFSGYSDMALGLARMFSLSFPVNFNSPYKATNIIDFWQRWHMTLTRYLNLYLFNPLALAMTRRRIRQGKKANRKAQRTFAGFFQLIAFPMIFTMFLAGIWHGAGMQFILFGLAHAFYLTVNHAWRVFVPEDSRLQKLLPGPVGTLITFSCVLVGQVFFRASSARDAFYVLGSLVGFHHGASFAGASLPSMTVPANSPWALIVLVFLVVWTLPNTQEILGQSETGETRRSLFLSNLRWQPGLVWCCGMIVLITASLALMFASTSFLYFQF